MSDFTTSAVPREPSLTQRSVVLAAAFLGWMFAGMEIALFVLIHRPAMVSLLAGSPGQPVDEQLVTQWFAWYQAAFLFGAASGGWVFGWLGDRCGRT
ncbi:MAG TPA: MFS transporter, partial [Planctomycetaceae bacterium]|nr:MFS transporter [Planctomycetaceae bacterium]